MFADLGHFSVRAIQDKLPISAKTPKDVGQAFYSSVPGPLYWPQFVVTVLASIIANQAMISGTFSTISQSLSLGCFPKVKSQLPSKPLKRSALHMECCCCCDDYHDMPGYSHNAGYMEDKHMFIQGGYLPLAYSLVLLSVMAIWYYVHRKRYLFELEHKVSSEIIGQLAANPVVNRVPGIGLFYSELVQGIPPIFPHFIAQIPSIHSVLVFVSTKKISVTRAAPEERFLFRQVKPRECRMFCCVVRYGYMDVMGEPEVFERHLVEHLK
ncbi:hypothetical protein SLEP1_g6603 [Rubroshorea leprosula]|uniref:Uncharacterized protein n=1 Tax=Rubroshorea leprosula TaxID=152421 RepID=A0AAV5I6N6_9ROSI|nr:hypothetical protein SLEP1_g6603 [Rubroshorea leprosula]